MPILPTVASVSLASENDSSEEEVSSLTRREMVEVLMDKYREFRLAADQGCPSHESWTRHEWACIAEDLILYSGWIQTIARHVERQERREAIVAARKTPEVPPEFWTFIGAPMNVSEDFDE